VGNTDGRTPPIIDLDAYRKPRPVQRRPRRDEPVTLRVRVDLSYTEPPLWRRLELSSDLHLDEVHQVIQASFGWTDSHLHRFGCGPSYYSTKTVYYLCPFSADDGDNGVPEEDVRLDEVLVKVGDKLFYEYDFGDSWLHLITVEAVSERAQSAPQAICTDGDRPGPAEDCGGVPGYELMVVANDPDHPDHREAREHFAAMYGADVEPQEWAPVPFDADRVNRLLAVDI